ncbi:MoxR family ATPase [Candidatus Peregrinibacteria bacterium]|nr:MoxR family ATPase [Candidatus Peregrinibacteria bacterium]
MENQVDAGLGNSDIELVRKLKNGYDAIKAELHRIIVGQDRVLDELLTCIFSRGHALLVGVPGLAKTLMIRSVSQCLTLSFNRIQFTPDLMPSDITGTEVLYEDKAGGGRQLRFISGPIFSNIILADEINRTPPKTQAALLEAMQELQVTVGGKKHELAQPFFVLATQNPIEQEGTYPLPEAQLDRFMFLIQIDYPTEEEEMEIMKLTTSPFEIKLSSVLSGEEILKLQDIVRRVPIADHIIKYAMAIARATRAHEPEAPDFIKSWVQWGAGPRASQFLIIGAKAHAILNGRYFVSTDDIKAVAHPVLRHRIITNFTAEAEGITSDIIVDKLLEVIPSKASELAKDKNLPKVFETTE